AVFIITNGVVCPLGIGEQFTCLCEELSEAFLVLEFEPERVIGKCEPIVEVIGGFDDVAMPPGIDECAHNSVGTCCLRRPVGEGGGSRAPSPTITISAAGASCHFAALMKVVCVYSSRPSRPISRPTPDCFAPPYGVSSCMSRCLFPQTVPASIWDATPKA